MTLLQAYLRSPKARRALSKRPGDKGFSLIELVVVVAILAILAAIALPNFLGVSKDGQIAAAKNTLATIVKECAVKDTRYTSDKYGTEGSKGSAAAVQSRFPTARSLPQARLQTNRPLRPFRPWS